jgi:hypothetical protein
VTAIPATNPEKVESQSLGKGVQPFPGCVFSKLSPRVVRSSQPWAESGNPVGIVTNHAFAFGSLFHSTENSGESSTLYQTPFRQPFTSLQEFSVHRRGVSSRLAAR